MDHGLFNLDDPAPRNEERAPMPLSPTQRQAIRELFAQLGVTDARAQFDMVAELTGEAPRVRWGLSTHGG